MKYQAILFDLDGTLLPMDYDTFLRGYLGLLAEHVAPLGYEKKALVGAMWQGVAAMTANNGTRTNCEAFWQVFAGIFGDGCYAHIPLFDAFYSADFHKAKAFTAPAPEKAREAVRLAREKAERVVLATSPLFPREAVKSRLAWAGLTLEDFDLVTEYENSTTCKPNPAYYLEICKKIGVDPTACLMIGNNVEEDITPSAQVGMDGFLMTDYLLAAGEIPPVPKGSFDDAIAFLQKL
jgi:FMN phosphatase YigB (HAD superfamily)